MNLKKFTQYTQYTRYAGSPSHHSRLLQRGSATGRPKVFDPPPPTPFFIYTHSHIPSDAALTPNLRRLILCTV